MKRVRSGSPALTVSPTSYADGQGEEHRRQLDQQRVEERGRNDRVVVNSPYGANRARYGWGNLFSPPLSAHIPEYPEIHIGISSLNCVPGKDRRMKTLLAQYSKKFNCLEHCYTYHNMGDESMWKSWMELGSSLSTSFASFSPQKDRNTSSKKESERGGSNCSQGKDVKISCSVNGGLRTDLQPNSGDIRKEHLHFMYTVKANQYLTHIRMLAMDETTEDHILQFFLQRCALLREHLGPVLMQLPPQFQKTNENMKRLVAVAARIPSTIRVAVEFRHRSWYIEEVYELLRRLGWGLVVAHHHDTPVGSVHVDTSVPFMYVRLHGANGLHVGDYGPTLLLLWAERIVEFLRAGGSGHNNDEADVAHKREVFFFFNNSDSHIGGTTSSTVDATFLAQQVRMLLSKDGTDSMRVSRESDTTTANSSRSSHIVGEVTIIGD